MKNSEQPAYPIEEKNPVYQVTHFGFNKRELIAAMNMQGLIGNQQWIENAIINELSGGKSVANHIAGCAVEFADALLQELEKQTDNPELLK